MKKTLERITVLGFVLGIVFAENIPLMVLCFAAAIGSFKTYERKYAK